MACNYHQRHGHLKPALLTLLLLVVTTAAIPVQPDPAVAMLLRIKADQLVDPAGRLSSWTAASASPCNWTGVVCDPSSLAVVAVHLSGFGLAGGFPAAFCHVPSLRSLSLAENNLNGTLSAGAVSACFRLRSLNLSSNCFVGDVPEFEPEFADLRMLDLSFNNFSGRIPASFGRFPALQVLNLFSNLLTGVIPAFLANLTELTQFNLAYNSFDPGPLPPELGDLTKLESIWLPFTNLNGNIPDSIGNLALLKNLDLSNNDLTGKIPASIGGLRSVEQIELYRNRLSGELPESLGELTALLEFDASENNLSGRLPENFAGLKLNYLGLNDNQLEGDIPAVLALNPNLVELKLFNNRFFGEIPKELGQHCDLEHLDIAGNGFVGHLPSNLCARRKLRRLVAFDNQLSGGIPESYGDCSSLDYIRLQNNRLSGEIPDRFWSLPKVYHLELRRNQFEGRLPPAISGARNLTKLLISSNNFSGSITSNVCDLAGLTIIGAGGNSFTGDLPSCLAGLPSLQILNLQSNNFSGGIPAGSWPYLVELDLSSNKLSGNIPSSLGDLPVLTYLDLSDNLLSGEIPLELSNLKFNVLNLSGNHLVGEIPAGFDTVFYLSSLLRNPGLCSPSRLPPFPPCSTVTRARNVTVILVVAAALLAFGLLLFSGLIWFHLKRFKEPFEPEPGAIWKLTYSFDQIKFDESEIMECLKEANLIGTGGSGRVYRVRLGTGQVVAVKKIRVDPEVPDKDRAFRNEVETLGRVRHANIVRLLFCCAASEYRLLVYEYMENGSLEAFLHGGGGGGKEQQQDERLKDWGRRAKIAIGAARGLAYLHHDCVPPVVHRDVKPSNILLDRELEARVGDFGLARALPSPTAGEEDGDQGHLVMTNVAGSCGYIAPEYAYTLRVNEKSDVYSFGIVLLELVTGKRAIDDVCFGENKDIVRWVSEQVASEGATGKMDLRFLVDTRLRAVSSSQYDEVVRFLHVALLCTSTFPMNRPSMRRVVEMLRDPKSHPPSTQIDVKQ